jgi:hypothetical protein
MNCRKFDQWVDDLVGHDLSPEMAATLTEHARRCERCAKEWRAALERAAALQTWTPWALEAADVQPPAPGSTADAVFGRLANGEGARPAWGRLVRPLAAAAAVVAMAGAGFFAWRIADGDGALRTPATAHMNAVANGPVAGLWNVQNGPSNEWIPGQRPFDFATKSSSGEVAPLRIDIRSFLNAQNAGNATDPAAVADERLLNPAETKLLLESAVQGVWPNFNVQNVSGGSPARSGAPGNGYGPVPFVIINDGAGVKVAPGARRF